MKVRTRKARINFTLARELWLTPHLKRVADAIVRESDENIKNGKYETVTVEQLVAEAHAMVEELFNEKSTKGRRI